jgi:hypothetical protein
MFQGACLLLPQQHSSRIAIQCIPRSMGG